MGVDISAGPVGRHSAADCVLHRPPDGPDRLVPDDHLQPAVVVAPVELDVASAPQFVRDLDAAFATGAHLVVADFGGTTFCDSSGLKALVHTAKRANARKQRFEVRHPSRMLLRMAEILGAASLLGLPIDD